MEPWWIEVMLPLKHFEMKSYPRGVLDIFFFLKSEPSSIPSSPRTETVRKALMEIHNLLPPLLPAETIPRSPSPQTAEEYLREFSSTQKAIVFFWHIFVEKSTSINRSQTFLLGTLSRSLQFWVKTPWGWPFNWLFFSGSLAVLGSPKGQDWSLEISGPGTF